MLKVSLNNDDGVSDVVTLATMLCYLIDVDTFACTCKMFNSCLFCG